MGRSAIAAAGVIALLAPAQALAFDTAPHFDVTGDALTADGFGRDAARVVQVNNWFVDFYSNPKAVPQSSHAPWWKTLLGARWYLGEIETWPIDVIRSAAATHFDSHDGGWGYRQKQSLEAEWARLLDRTVRICRSAAGVKDPLTCLTALGASLHEVQDFYTHSNWVEPAYTASSRSWDGPGWEAGQLGTAPTWFDLPPAVRDPAVSRVYTNGPGTPVDVRDRLFNRPHGSWRSDRNESLVGATNKDWPGRPRFAEAYMGAYFATRQWADAVRRAVADPQFWASVRGYRPPTAKSRTDLRHDVNLGARAISYWAGHWQGQGEPTGGDDPGPGGSLDDIFLACREYFKRDRTLYRGVFERTIPRLRDTTSPVQAHEVIPTRALQEATRFVVVKILRMKGRGAGDIGPDRADFYAQGLIAGQQFLSAFIHGRDSYSFPRPNYPFTFVKAVNASEQRPVALTDLLVQVRTSSASGAGTDDSVYLRISDSIRFELDKVATNDFERGSTATYSLPVDTSTPFDRAPTGYLLSDLRYVQLEKSRDGPFGAWKLGGVTVWANGRVVYRTNRIERWLEKDRRTWRAANFHPPAATSTRVPVWLSLWDADSFLYGGDDHADLHPARYRRHLGVNYVLDTVVDETTVGGSAYSGSSLSVDGDRAEIRYRIETLRPYPPPLPQPPPPMGLPDLVISALDLTTFTVRNQGNAAAGPFSVQVVGYNTIAFPGLAAGAEEKRTYTSGCSFGIHEARADYLNQVVESDETNNVRTIDVIC